MIAVKKVENVHTLEHPTRNRRYHFVVLEDGGVQVQRFAEGYLDYRVAMTRETARDRYAFLLRIGYEKW